MPTRKIPYLFNFPPISLADISNHLAIINKEIFDTPTGGQINSGISTFTSISANLTAKGDLLASITTVSSTGAPLTAKGDLLASITTVTSTTANLTEALIGGAIAASISTDTTTSANLTAKGDLQSSITTVSSTGAPLTAKGDLLASITTVTSTTANLTYTFIAELSSSIFSGSVCLLDINIIVPSFELIHLTSTICNNQLNETSNQLNALIIISSISTGIVMNSRIPGKNLYSVINTKTNMNGTLN
jgi:hypothetical protein